MITSSSPGPSLASSRISRRTLLSAVVVGPAVAALLAGCGDNSSGAGAYPPDPTGSTGGTPGTATPGTATPGTATPGTATPGTGGDAGIEHPRGADEVIVRLGYYGGLVQRGVAFANVPSVLIAGDGRVFTPGVTPAIFPGPLLPAINVRTITEAGIQIVLGTAHAAGLLQTPPDYAVVDINVADAATTQLVLDAAGATFVHEAYALGLRDPAETKTRNVLNGVVIRLGDLETLVGAENLGADAPVIAEAYRMQAYPLAADDLAGYSGEPKPTVVPWPVTVGVALASAAECVVVPAAAAGTLFADADQLTLFSEGDVVYSLSVVAMLPGDTC